MRILSGIKPTGVTHLGNYLGAIRQFVELQSRGESYIFIADYHSMDPLRDAEQRRKLTWDLVLDYLAHGLDPQRVVLFRQSDVPEVTALMWALGSVTPMGLLQRGHAYKDALAKDESPDFGLFAYPVLMAADILLYRPDAVPVGQDQKQHVEFTRDIAVKFNQTYCPDFDPESGEGGVLKIPEPLILPETAIVPGVDGRKMSKTYGNTIPTFAPDKQLKKAVMRIVTDSRTVEEPKDPATCNVFALLKHFSTADELAEVEAQYAAGGLGYGHFKKLLLERIHRELDHARARRRELEQDPTAVEQILVDGAARARQVASVVLDDVLRASGIR